MGTVLIILGLLFLSLIIIVPLVERFGKKQTDEEANSLSRFVLPLIAFLLVLQLIAFYFF